MWASCIPLWQLAKLGSAQSARPKREQSPLCSPARGQQSIHEKYVLSRACIGRGSFGAVYLAQPAVGAEPPQGAEFDLVVKVADLRHGREAVDKEVSRRWRQEVDIMCRIAGHRNVVEFVEGSREDGLAYIVMEQCRYKLVQWLDLLPELTTFTLRGVFQQMLAGIAAVHAAGVVHRDVKPENFLVDRDGVVKLTDFGLSKVMSGDSLRGACGTAPFMAPEMLGDGTYGVEVDVWAFGVIAYVLFYGQFPHMASCAGEMKEAIRVGSPPPTFARSPELYIGDQGQLGSQADSFVRGLLERDPRQRTTADGAREASFLSQSGVTSAPEAAHGPGESLRPMLLAARRLGAFGNPRGAELTAAESGIDTRLASLQDKFHQCTLECGSPEAKDALHSPCSTFTGFSRSSTPSTMASETFEWEGLLESI